MFGRKVNSEKITGFGGKIIGYIDTDENGNQRARDFYYRIIGYYDKATDTTRDFYGRIQAHGNQVVGMLFKDNKDIK